MQSMTNVIVIPKHLYGGGDKQYELYWSGLSCVMNVWPASVAILFSKIVIIK